MALGTDRALHATRAALAMAAAAGAGAAISAWFVSPFGREAGTATSAVFAALASFTITHWLVRRGSGAYDEALRTKIDLVNRLALAAEYQDDGRSGHNRRIGSGAEIVAKWLGVPPARARLIGRAALLHDIGKIGVPHEILAKPGALTEQERALVEGHVVFGAHLLEGSSDPILATGWSICMTHHERWDGQGYPRRLAREAIPIEGRIVAVCDVFDALASKRPYKEPWPLEAARDAIIEGRGTQFDPAVVDAFLAGFDEILALREAVADELESLVEAASLA